MTLRVPPNKIRAIRVIRVQKPLRITLYMTICVPLSPYNPLSPEEMPDSEEWFAQSLFREIPHQTHIPV